VRELPFYLKIEQVALDNPVNPEPKPAPPRLSFPKNHIRA
jgi:hypothetical protein